MRIGWFFGISILIVSAIIAITSVSTSAVPAAPSYGFDLTIVPDHKLPDTYQAKLAIRELTSDKVVAAPVIVFREGETGNITTGETADGVSCQFSVSVKDAVAEYDTSVLQAKTTVFRSHGKITLKNISDRS